MADFTPKELNAIAHSLEDYWLKQAKAIPPNQEDIDFLMTLRGKVITHYAENLGDSLDDYLAAMVQEEGVTIQ